MCEPDHRTTYRKVLEWGCQQMIEANDMEQARVVWDRFPVLHHDWRFVGIKNNKKKELLNEQ